MDLKNFWCLYSFLLPLPYSNLKNSKAFEERYKETHTNDDIRDQLVVGEFVASTVLAPLLLPLRSPLCPLVVANLLLNVALIFRRLVRRRAGWPAIELDLNADFKMKGKATRIKKRTLRCLLTLAQSQRSQWMLIWLLRYLWPLCLSVCLARKKQSCLSWSSLSDHPTKWSFSQPVWFRLFGGREMDKFHPLKSD